MMTRDTSESIRYETQLKRANFGVKCSKCHKIEHNKATCKLPTPSQSIQPEPNQLGSSHHEETQPGPSQTASTMPEVSHLKPSQTTSTIHEAT